MKKKTGILLIFLVFALSVTSLFFLGPIPQDPAYHQFSDTRTLLAIPNFFNTVSNLPFLYVGIVGLIWFMRPKSGTNYRENRWAYPLLYAGVALVGLGSGYYHLAPDNHTLVWDRLPMTIAFMALFSIIISEYISASLGRFLLAPLIITGATSVLYWHYTESLGQGDLRFYAVIQFFPMLAIPIILLCFKSGYSRTDGYWWLLATYLAAKLLEHFDGQIYDLLPGLIGGHSLKHLAPAIGLYILLDSYKQRTGVQHA